MDAHIFRRVAAELAPLVHGARVSKIYSLNETALLLVLDAKTKQPPQKLHLVVRHGREQPALFLAPERPLAPHAPDAPTMRLRKYVQGKHIRGVHSLWEHRTLALDFSNPTGTEPLLLLLNIAPPPGRPAALLHFGPAPDFELEPKWPPPDELADILADAESYKRFPVLSPLLRKTLALLDAGEQAALLADLRTGEGDIFVYEAAGGGQPRSARVQKPRFLGSTPESPAGRVGEGYAINDAGEQAALLADLRTGEGDIFVYEAQTPAGSGSAGEVTGGGIPAPLLSAWPLPAPLRAGRAERIFTPETNAHPSLAAAARCFAAAAMDAAHDADRASDRAADLRERKRALRLAAKLDEEERKLRSWIDAQTDAVLLQTWLHALPKDLKTDAVTLESEHGPRRISLDPLLTIAENMERLFRLAAKGKRGVKHLEARREELAGPGGGKNKTGDGENRRAGATPPETQTSPHKDISRFHSANGFVILRGKNAHGNRALLKLAAPHDLWLHSQTGPSAHTLLRRAHALIEVPEIDLEQAAVLTALKSAWKNDARAEIMVALARDVRPVKGGAPGQVLVDKIQRTLVVRPDAALEERLAGK